MSVRKIHPEKIKFDRRMKISFRYLPLLVVGLALFIWFGPLLLGGKALFWGTPSLQFIPWWSYAFQTVLDGHLPLWNPGLGMGAPLLANYQTALFYPPTWILAVFYVLGGVPWLAWGLTPVLSLHLLFSAWGMALLLKRLGCGVFEQTLSALTWVLSSYLTARVNFPPILFCAAWLPWVLLLLTPEKGKPFFSRNKFLYLVLCLAFLLLGGHAQTAWYILLLAAAWCAYWALFDRAHHVVLIAPEQQARQAMTPERWQSLQRVIRTLSSEQARGFKRLAQRWVWFGAALFLAAGVASVQLWPTAEYLLQSQRATAVDFDLAISYSLWPWRLISLLAPGFFGNPVQGDYWGYANYWEDALYVGLLPLLLAIAFIVRSTKMNSHLRSKPSWLSCSFKVWVVGVMLLTLIWALGRFTPVFPWLYQHVPTFNLFQAPSRVLILFEFSLAVLAGLGANIWRRPQGKALYWTRLATAGAIAVSLGAGLAWTMLDGVNPTALRATVLAGGWGLLAGILSLTAPSANQVDADLTTLSYPKLSIWHVAVLALVAVDLLVAAWGLNPGVPLDFYAQTGGQSKTASLSSSERAYMPATLEKDLKYKRFFRFDTFSAAEPWSQMRVYLLPNLGLLEGQAMLNNYDPLAPGRYQKWMTHLESLPVAEQQGLLAWMNVDQVLVAAGENLLEVERRTIEGNHRLHWVSCALAASDERSSWQQAVSSDLNWQQQVVLEDESLSADSVCVSSAGDNLAALQWMDTQEPNRKLIEVRSTTDGWMVLADTWYPGWQVRLDGQPRTLLRANYLFQAVYVPQGDHIVELVYRPLSFWGGVCLSLLSLAFAGLLAVWGRHKNDPA
jgi:hypothetical protein